jgi:hypothetical protein
MNKQSGRRTRIVVRKSASKAMLGAALMVLCTGLTVMAQKTVTMVTDPVSGAPMVLNGWVYNSTLSDDGDAGNREGYTFPTGLTVGLNNRVFTHGQNGTTIHVDIFMDASKAYANTMANNATTNYNNLTARVKNFNHYDNAITARNHWRYTSAVTGNLIPKVDDGRFGGRKGSGVNDTGRVTYNPETQTYFSLGYTANSQTRTINEWQPRNIVTDAPQTDDNLEKGDAVSQVVGVGLASITPFTVNNDRNGIAYDHKTGTTDPGGPGEAFNLLTLDTTGGIRRLTIGVRTAGTTNTWGSRAYGSEVWLGSVAASLPAGSVAVNIKVNPADGLLYVLSRDDANNRCYLTWFDFTTNSLGAAAGASELTWRSGVAGVDDDIPDLLRPIGFDFGPSLVAGAMTLYVANSGYCDGPNAADNGAVFIFTVKEAAPKGTLIQLR